MKSQPPEEIPLTKYTLTPMQAEYLAALANIDGMPPVEAANLVDKVVRAHRARPAFLRRLSERGLIEQATLGTRRIVDVDRPVVGYRLTEAGRAVVAELSGQ